MKVSMAVVATITRGSALAVVFGCSVGGLSIGGYEGSKRRPEKALYRTGAAPVKNILAQALGEGKCFLIRSADSLRVGDDCQRKSLLTLMMKPHPMAGNQ
jgi:hypothetical protein